ncbi:MAG: EamA family transporter [Woeseia sp.]|nr:EamA family transporter [Woeseia sp.]MBT8096979.1 EamA family transporter [Woeseia sp.]NNL55922.1 EamA family transporter [Woeseia sp.]
MSNGILYALTVAIWGSTWLAIEFQLGVVAPDVSVFYRYVLAAAIMLGWCFIRGLPLKFQRDAHWRFMAMGLFMFCLNYLLTYYAQVHITSALAAIAFTSMLWMNMIYARLFFGIRNGIRAIAGSVLGIIGVVIIFYPQIGSVSVDDATLFGFLLALAGAMLASLGNMVSQDAQRRGLPIVQSNAWGMSYGALFTGLIVLGGDSQITFDWSGPYVLSLLYLTFFGTIVAFGAYLTLLGRIGAHKVGYAVVLFPVVAVMLSVAFEGLPLTASLIFGVVLVLAGNFFVVQSKTYPTPVAQGVGVADKSSSAAATADRHSATTASAATKFER